LYEVLLAVHILAAVVWVGSNFAQQFFAMRAKQRGPEAIAGFAQDMEWYGMRFNMGASLVLILTAFPLASEGGYDLGEPWLIFAILVWLTSFVLGAAVLGPTGKKAGLAIAAAGGSVTTEAQAHLDRLFAVARIELVLLILVVIDMAVKPGL
jgi:uncharacterized membrane protein